MSDHWEKLLERLKDLQRDRAQLQELLYDRKHELDSALRRKDEQIKELQERIEKAREIYKNKLKDIENIKPGYYWARNKFRKDPDHYDLLILVKEPNDKGVQEWCLLYPSLIGWQERENYEYKLGDYIAEER